MVEQDAAHVVMTGVVGKRALVVDDDPGYRKGSLAATDVEIVGIAQELSSELSVILTSARCLAERLGAGDPRSLDALAVQNAGEHAESLTRRLLALSRRRLSDTGNIDLNAVVCGFEPTIRRQLGDEAKLVITLGDELGTVRANAAQIEQVLLNLVLNARDAISGGGTVRIRTANLARFDDQPTLPAGEYVVLSVRDTGRGMDAETRRRALEPFFTTKEPGSGTGLGLSTCYEIARQSGGHIAIESEPGHGTVVSMYLPRSDPRSRSSSAWYAGDAPGLW